MRIPAKWAILAGGLIAIIFTAGFFHAELKPEACTPSARACIAEANDAEESPRDQVYAVKAAPKPATAPAPKGLLALTNAPGYRRAADLSLRVDDCTKAEDLLETKLQDIKGEILEMLMEGTAGSRTCTLSVVIPSDKFRGFIADLRGMGKIQSERITASKLKPGQAGIAAEALDPRELSLVSLRMADEKVAPSVLESRGVLAASFDRSSSHFLKGLAVLVEIVGLILPFGLALAGAAIPFLIALRLRRAKPAVAMQ
jgi:hypothetical protein